MWQINDIMETYLTIWKKILDPYILHINSFLMNLRFTVKIIQ